MLHYSCDMCQCELDPSHDVRYVVRMEMYPAPSEPGADMDDDRDYLGDIDEVLERFDEFDADGELPERDAYQRRRFDLCSKCCQQFIKEPFGRRGAPQYNFSKR